MTNRNSIQLLAQFPVFTLLVILTWIQSAMGQSLNETNRHSSIFIAPELELGRVTIRYPVTDSVMHWLREVPFLLNGKVAYILDQGGEGEYDPILHLGFFESEDSALALWDQISMPDSDWQIGQVSDAQHEVVMSELRGSADTAGGSAPLVFYLSADNGISQQLTTAEMLQTARGYYDQGQFKQAALHYHVLASIADQATAAWATELMGLSLERLGNFELALNAYRLVLDRYPQAAGTQRVRQRMMGLQTRADDPQPRLRQADGGNDSGNWRIRGVFGQYYRTLYRELNNQGRDEVMSLLTTDFDFRASRQTSTYRLETRINGYSLVDRLDSSDSDLRVKRAYLEYEHLDSGLALKLGRQRDFDSGMFTSFDGLTVSYPLLDSLSLSVSGGKPVYFADIYDAFDYSFYAASLEWKLNESWQLVSYYNNQQLNNVTDREAVGLRLKFNNERYSSSLLVDYDVAFSELNNIMWNSNILVTENTTLSAVVGQQHSPFLTASNILIGQADLNLDVYLQSKENVDSLLDDALARTSLNRYYSLTVNSVLSDGLRFIGNFYDSTLTDIPSSSFLLGEEVQSQSNLEFSQKSLSTQIIKDSLFFTTESTAIGWRISNGSNSNSNQLFINERMRFGTAWTVAPRFSYSIIDYLQNSDRQNQTRYSVNAIYRPNRATEFNLELGNESIDRDLGGVNFDSTFLFLGYRLIF